MAWSDYFTGPAQSTSEAEKNLARQQAELDAKIKARQAEGTLSTEQFNYYNAGLSTAIESPNSAYVQGFGEGLKEGLDNVTGTTRKGIAGLINSVFAAIPWQLWVLGLVVGFFYIGGAGLLRRKVAKL